MHPCTSLAFISFPDNLTTIRGYAFQDCISLSSVTIPGGVTSIDGNTLFQGCTSLTAIEVSSLNAHYSSMDGVLFDKHLATLILCPEGKSGGYTMPEGVTSIGYGGFQGCTRLTSVSIPASVTAIGTSAFYGCTGLGSVDIQGSVSLIGDYTFFGCTSLTTVTLPESVSSVGWQAFYGCTSLGSVAVPNGITTISNYAFENCSGLTTINLPDSITSIGEGAFWGCTSLVSAALGSGLTEVRPYAFEGCTRLISVSLPHGLATIADMAFGRCTSLTSVAIPDSVTSVGFGPFDGCTSLTSVWIGSGANGINEFTFRSCTGLTEIQVSPQNPYFSSLDGVLFDKARTRLIKIPSARGGHFSIPNTVEEIRDLAFEGCVTLTSLLIPGSVAAVGVGDATGAGAITGCPALEQIEVEPANPYYSSLDGVLFNKDRSQLIQYPAGKTGAYAVPDSVVSIAEAAFMDCKGLTSVSLPESVSSIPSFAFANCSGLSSISIPSAVTEIGNWAFEGCEGLATLFIPDNCSSIGYRAFADCTGLANIFLGRGLTTYIDGWAFEGCTGLSQISVDELNPIYRSIDGVLFARSPFKLIKYPAAKPGEHYSVPDGVTEIGDGSHAFDRCKTLTSISIPASVSRIGYADLSEFQGCSNLTILEVDDTHSTSSYFSHEGVLFHKDVWNPSYIRLVRFPAGKVGNYAVPEWVSGINVDAFEGCTGLNSLVFLGDAPSFHLGFGYRNFNDAATGFAIYYFRGNLWFTSPSWRGYPSAMIDRAVHPAAEWLLGHGLPYDSDLHQDLNHDGVSLLVAYALNLDPNQDLRASLPRPFLDADHLSISFHGVSPGITYAVQTSTNLTHWTTEGVSLLPAGPDGRRTASVARSVPVRFLRLRVGD